MADKGRLIQRGKMTLKKPVILSLFAGTSLLVPVMALLLYQSIYNSNIQSEIEHLESTMNQIQSFIQSEKFLELIPTEWHGIIHEYVSDLSVLSSASWKSFGMGLFVILAASGFILFFVYWILGHMVINDLKMINQKLTEEMLKNTKDSLTGLYNRNKVEDEAQEIFRKKTPQGMLILIDLDNFKKVNDEAGHIEGDRVLKTFGQILDRQFRATDTKARLGGDEFVILLQQELTTEVLQMKLNRFLDEVRLELKEYYKNYKLSVSIGVAVITQDIRSYTELYKSADAAMYVAKRSGKDRFYVNKDNNTCMRENCICCRAICDRRKTLFGEKRRWKT